MGRVAAAVTLSEAERRELEGLARRQKTFQELARRARIVLAAADRLENKAIVARLEADAKKVGKWRRRFAEHRLDGLYDELRSRPPRKIGDEQIAEVIARTLEETPADGTHWSLRSVARASGYTPSTIHRIWQAFGLQPHRSETFKLSSDSLFVDKVRDIVASISTRPSARSRYASMRRARSRRWIAPDRFSPCGPARSSRERPSVSSRENVVQDLGRDEAAR